MERRQEDRVHVGEGLEIALGMAGGDARERLRARGEFVPAAREAGRRFVDIADLAVVAFLLGPFERRFCAVDPDAKAVVLADGDLRTPVEALRPAPVIDHDRGVVVEEPVFAEDVEPRAERFHLEPGQVRDHVLDMAADVADAVGEPGPVRVGPPGGLFLARLFKGRRQPVLGIFRGDEPDVAQLAVRDHVPHMIDDGITAVGVGDA